MERKITPTGVLILPADAERDVWLASRKEGITATDVPAILGLNKYKTAIDVWMEKVSSTDQSFEPGIGSMEAAFWGIQLEDVVAKAWAEQTGVSVRRIGIIAHHEHTWQRASLDRMVTGCKDGRCALEVKTRSGYVGDEWNAGVPADVAAQVHWQLLVSGLDHIHVIALIGGQRLVQHIVTLEGVNIPEMVGIAKTVWDAVATGEAPRLPETHWTDEYLEQLHPERLGAVEVDSETAESTLDNYLAVLELIKDLDARKAELRTQLVGALGEYEVATLDGQTLYTYKASTSKRLDTKALAELYPDAAGDDRVWNHTTSRTLRITTKKESK